MQRDAVVLGVIFAVLAAVLMLQLRGGAGVVIDQTDDIPGDGEVAAQLPNPGQLAGPNYLTYNIPYFFAPPINNFLPRNVAPGQGGGVVNVQPTYSSGPACASCS